MHVRSIAPGVYRIRAETRGLEPASRLVLVRPAEQVNVSLLLCEPHHVDVGGECCWPGQRVQDGQCTGTPSCPSPLVPDETQGCAPRSCAGGTIVDGGACCWQGQHWDAEIGVCMGRPTRCPDGRAPFASACIDVTTSEVVSPSTNCPAGQTMTLDTAGHCCWPMQVWATSRSRCVGVPNCPASLVADGETCIPAESLPQATPVPCGNGRWIAPGTAGHCCWQQQTWSSERGQCVGPPACPPGRVAQGETCVATDAQ